VARDEDGTPFVTEDEELRKTRKGSTRSILEALENLKQCARTGHVPGAPNEQGWVRCKRCGHLLERR